MPSLAGLQVVFEIGISGGDFLDGFGCLRSQGSPAHIGVNNDTAGIDDLAQGGGKSLLQFEAYGGIQRVDALA